LCASREAANTFLYQYYSQVELTRFRTHDLPHLSQAHQLTWLLTNVNRLFFGVHIAIYKTSRECYYLLVHSKAGANTAIGKTFREFSSLFIYSIA
jgi:hypothetical protein